MTEHDTRSDWRWLGLLVLLVLPIRGWLLYNTEVASRDSIGYIRYALAFERLPWHEVWKANDQHPGYPLAVYAMSLPVRLVTGVTDAPSLQLSAQLVSALMALVLLVPMYHLGRTYFSRQAAFGACLIFQYWPVSGQQLSDGISEPLFLVLVTSALLFGVRAVEGRSLARFVLCGVFAGLAYLTRPEGLLVLPATAMILVAQQAFATQRRPWGRFALSGSGLVAAALLGVSLYVYATGRITNKLSVLEVLHRFVELPPAEPQVAATGDVGFTALLFAARFEPSDQTSLQLTHSVTAVLMELNQGLHYVGSVSALVGLWWSFGALARRPGFWLLVCYAAIHAAILVALAMTVAYVSGRHTITLVLCGTYLVAAGLCELPRRLKAFVRDDAAPWWTLALCAGVVLVCLPKTAERLNGNRTGNNAAGLWLAGQLEPGDMIVDDHAWSHFYSGLLFEEGNEPVLPADARPRCFVVMTRSKDPDIDRERRAAERGLKAELVYHWPEQAAPESAKVLVYRQPRDFATQAWKKLSPPAR